MQRFVILCALVSSLSACTPETRSGGGVSQGNGIGVWKIQSSVDRLTDKRNVFLLTETSDVRAASRVSGANIGVLSVSCDVVLMLFGGPIGGPQNAIASVRADTRPARGDLFEVSADLRSIRASGVKAKAAIEYMTGAENLYVQVSSLTLGQTAADLRISGLREAMAAAELACK